MKNMEFRLGSQKQPYALGNSLEKEFYPNLHRERRKEVSK